MASARFSYLATLGETGDEGSDNNHFGHPIDVAVDKIGNIYVADSSYARVQRFFMVPDLNVVPEIPFGTVVALVSMTVSVTVFVEVKRHRIKQ
ncbi:MAG TPA: hypothetical protein VK209_09655 [Candidatus Sulfotelmatobacter sp.]|nr:hypothetical protein [Candidatus Sulfotelmatobacter sp.]